MRSSFSHHTLSPEPLCVLRSVHPEPSGDAEVVYSMCMRVSMCVRFRTRSYQCVSAGACVVMLPENSLARASQTR